MSEKKFDPLSDSVQKLLVYLISGATVFLSTTAIENNRDIAVIREQLKPVSSFVEKPRFTHQDFNEAMKSYAFRLDRLEDQISIRGSWMDRTDNRLTKIESKGEKK